MTEAAPEAVLADLPDALWPSLLQAVRTASGRLGKAQLSVELRPYSGFTPAKLGRGRARVAVIAAVVADARLRDAIGEVLGHPLLGESRAAAVNELLQRFPAADAAAALVAHARWRDLQALALQVTEAGATKTKRPPAPEPAPAGDRAALAALRRERTAAQRSRDAAQRRVADLESQLEQGRAELARLRDERDAAAARADEERARLRDRLARLQRQVSRAEAQSREDRARTVWLADELDRLSAALRAPPDEAAAAPPAAVGDELAEIPVVPRTVRAATPGRPAVLPPGIAGDQPAAVLALLEVPGIEVIVDGYNVTKDMRGVPNAGLADQRAWLVRIAAAVAAGREVRVTVVFDGDGQRTSGSSAARVVRCVFTAQDETADERIVAMVADLPSDAPVLVVTSDREVRTDAEELDANVVASGVFLQAVA